MSRPLKILSVGHSYVVAMNRSILRELAEDPQFEVTIGAPSLFKGSLRTIEMEPEPSSSKVRLVSLDAYMTSKMHIFAYDHFQLKKLFQQGYDCAHFWEEPYIFSGYQLTRMAKKYKIPYLFRTAQSLIKNYAMPFRYFEKASLKDATAFVAGGHLVYEAMRKKGWQKPGEILTLAVDTKAFQPFDDLKKKQGRDQWGLRGPVIGYLGRLSEEKGLDLAMKALGNLKEIPWNFLVMGSGPYKEKILSWAEQEGLKERVKVLLLKHSQVPDLLPLCDLLICPSQTRSFWKEQFGRMIVEAFAAGVPVMGSDSGEIPRVIGEAGQVLPESDIGAWQNALKLFLNSPQSFSLYREKGLERVHRYSAKSIANQYKSFYQKVAEEAF